MVGVTQSPDDDLLRFLDDDVRARVLARAKELASSVAEALNDMLRGAVESRPLTAAEEADLAARVQEAERGDLVDDKQVLAKLRSEF